MKFLPPGTGFCLSLRVPLSPPASANGHERCDRSHALVKFLPPGTGFCVLPSHATNPAEAGAGMGRMADAFGIDRAKKAERAWRDLFGDRRCHMTDLHARKAAFADVSPEEADRLCRGAVAIINSHASLIVAASCDVSEVEPLLPRKAAAGSEFMLNGTRGVYNCCLHWTMHAAGMMLGDRQRVSYWFETGDEFQGAAAQWLAHMIANKTAQRFYSHSSHAFVSKEDAHLFEVADLVAWEWGKHVDRWREGKQTRPSLVALMGNPSIERGNPRCGGTGRLAMHHSGEFLRTYFDKYARIATATSREQIAAVVNGESTS